MALREHTGGYSGRHQDEKTAMHSRYEGYYIRPRLQVVSLEAGLSVAARSNGQEIMPSPLSDVNPPSMQQAHQLSQ